MNTAIALVSLVIAGPGLLTLGIRSLRTAAWKESVPVAEWLIDRAAGIEPPARTAWDRRFAHIQAWLLVIFGSFFSLGLAAVIFSLFA
ncbi:MAG: hypothetical protein ACTHM8_01720 [Sphingomonas sp.]